MLISLCYCFDIFLVVRFPQEHNSNYKVLIGYSWACLGYSKRAEITNYVYLCIGLSYFIDTLHGNKVPVQFETEQFLGSF